MVKFDIPDVTSYNIIYEGKIVGESDDRRIRTRDVWVWVRGNI